LGALFDRKNSCSASECNLGIANHESRKVEEQQICTPHQNIRMSLGLLGYFIIHLGVRAGVHDALVMAGIWSDDHGLL
jgi:hypothetical protein